MNLAVLNGTALLSTAATLGGLLTALIGAVIWARRAPSPDVLWAVASISLLIVVLAAFVKINVHGPTAIFMFVTMAAVAAVGLLLITTFDCW